MIFKLKVFFHYLRTRYCLRFRSRESLLSWQEKKVVRFVAWAKIYSRFYGEMSRGIDPRDWRKIPLIDKSIMMKNLTDLNTAGVDREQALEVALKAEESRDFSPTLNGVSVGLSSGTSGNRGLFLVSDSERARYAGTILAKVLRGSLFAKNRVAFFMRANNNLYTASQSRTLRFEFFDLLKPIEEQLARLGELDPTLLFAPPSVLLRLARAARAGRLSVRPRKIYSIAETLDPLDQKQIEAAFGSKVHQVYQCTEGFLGITCDYGVLHLNEDLVSIEPEWVDRKEGKFIPIITDFSRKTQPMIRYRLNDILTARRESCSCGSHLLALECIEGRADDLVFFRSRVREEWIPVLPDFVRRSIIRASEEVSEYLASQSELGRLEIALVLHTESSRTEAERAVLEEIQKLCEEIGALPPEVKFVDRIETSGSAKLRRVRRICAPPAAALS